MAETAMIKTLWGGGVYRVVEVRGRFPFLLPAFGLLHLLFGQERVAERLVKIVAALEILTSVSVGFAEQPVVHHVEDEFAEILAAVDAPFVEDGRGHRAKLLERELPYAVEQLAAADV